MPLYEHVFMARQDISTAQMDALTDQFKTVITDNGGTIGRSEYWGLKPLTYRIRKNRKAHYALMNLDAPAPAIAEMERQMGLNEDIIRFMTIRVEEHEEEPSVQMRAGRERSDRPGGDRGDRGDRGPRTPRPPRDDAAKTEGAS
jgi:small subunit ribosomal protein S6